MLLPRIVSNSWSIATRYRRRSTFGVLCRQTAACRETTAAWTRQTTVTPMQVALAIGMLALQQRHLCLCRVMNFRWPIMRVKLGFRRDLPRNGVTEETESEYDSPPSPLCIVWTCVHCITGSTPSEEDAPLVAGHLMCHPALLS